MIEKLRHLIPCISSPLRTFPGRRMAVESSSFSLLLTEISGHPSRGEKQFMIECYIQNLFAERIGGKQYGKSTAIYKFAKIKAAKRAALAANPGAEIIDMGVGEPDEMAFPEVVAELHKEASKPENRGYADRSEER